MDFAILRDYRVQTKESENVDKYLELARELKKNVDRAGDDDTYCSWYTWNGPHKSEKESGTDGDQRKNLENPDYGITEIGQNTEKSPGDLKRYAVTHSLLKADQLTLV